VKIYFRAWQQAWGGQSWPQPPFRRPVLRDHGYSRAITEASRQEGRAAAEAKPFCVTFSGLAGRITDGETRGALGKPPPHVPVRQRRIR